jgi:DNA-directed RNA polymerase sigma subunit (sigma70/sigma32)
MPDQSDAQFFDGNIGVVDLIRQAIERVRPWMAHYVKSKLDFTVSENDFTDRIVERLSTPKPSPKPGKVSVSMDEPSLVEAAVKDSLKILVHEEKRSAYRKKLTPLDDAIPDPQGASFVMDLETESAAREILSQIPKDMLPIMKSLYGLSGEEVMTVREVAAKLGIEEEVLRKRLSRFRASLRERLRKKPKSGQE